MKENELKERLSQISTLWGLLEKAHGNLIGEATEAKNLLLKRYFGAVYYYLLGAVRDQEAAEELCQEFVTRFLRGDFRQASPARGRFRDYLRKSLINLVNDYHRQRKAQPRALQVEPEAAPPAVAETETEWLECWRQELITRAWAALAEKYSESFAVLICHVQNPDGTAAEKARELEQSLGKPYTPGQIRVLLHRARKRFAQFLLDEVAHSLEQPGPDEVEQELRSLQLWSYCLPVLSPKEEAN